jgi:hypothetical protein
MGLTCDERGISLRLMSNPAHAARPDLEAYEHAARIDFPGLVEELCEILGPKLVAYVADIGEVRAVRQWSAGEREPRAPIQARLRLALQVAWLIARYDDASVARAWFQGLNPQLDDRSAARLLREGDLDEVGPQILSAARAFVSGG